MPNPDSRDGVTLAAHPGQRGVLLAFDLDEQDPALRANLAGFAVRGQELAPNASAPFWLKNFLDFPPFDASKSWEDSDRAPFQMFHWIHFPQHAEGRYRYTMWPVYFVPGQDPKSPGGLRRDDAQSRTVEVSLRRRPAASFELGFTRGFMSSQAYLNFTQKNGLTSGIKPDKQGQDHPRFDTQPFVLKYDWLGASARRLVADFTARWADPAVTVDVFAYDLNEPDIIRAIGALGARGRAIVDDSVASRKNAAGKVTKSGHGLPGSAESRAAKWLAQQGVTVKRLHFKRFSHDKVFVLRRNGVAEAVLTGSANFSLRGFYVQSNSVLLLDDAEVAGWYATAFEHAWAEPAKFATRLIAKKWFAPAAVPASLPPMRVSFAPHAAPAFTVEDMARRIRKAKESALFSIMTPTGTGNALKVLTKDMVARQKFLLIGTTENKSGVKTFKSAVTSDSEIVPFAFLKAGTPPPFRAELSGSEGGGGQHIHHKFVVLDFNGAKPTVYCGSSNLAAGGETANGDNLLEINDRDVATAYAVEAIALYDHFRFRASQQAAKQKKKPFTLAADDGWTAEFYDKKKVKALQRKVYAKRTP